MSIIAGGEVGLIFRYLTLLMSYQWNGDIGGSSITVDGEAYNYTRGSNLVTLGIRLPLPFRKE
jgi:hypothetical protein